MLTNGFKAHDVWKISEGLWSAMAPINSRPSYGGTEKYSEAINKFITHLKQKISDKLI